MNQDQQAAPWFFRWIDELVSLFETKPLQVLIGFFVGHIVIRSCLPMPVGFDEGEQLIVTQEWLWGYSGQPPLYNWLQLGLFSIIGFNSIAMIVLKQSILLAIYTVVYFIWRKIGLPIGLAAACAFSLFMFNEVGWEMQRTRTHLSAAVLLVSLFTLTAIQIFQSDDSPKGSVLDSKFVLYGTLGIWAGLGMLAKYNFFVFPVGLAIAATCFASTRPKVLTPWVLLTVTVAVALFGPHFLWYQQVGHQFGSTLTTSFAADSLSASERIFQGLTSFGETVLFFFLQPIIIFLILTLDVRDWKYSSTEIFSSLDERTQRQVNLIGIACLISIGIMLAIIVAGGITEVRNRWLVPTAFLAIGPVLLRTRFLHGPNLQRIYWLAIFVIFVASTIAICKSSIDGFKQEGDFSNLPILSGQLWEQAELNPEQTLFVINDQRVAAQIRFHNPAYRIAAPDYVVPAQTGTRKRFVLAELKEGELIPELVEFLKTHFPTSQIRNWELLEETGSDSHQLFQWAIGILE